MHMPKIIRYMIIDAISFETEINITNDAGEKGHFRNYILSGDKQFKTILLVSNISTHTATGRGRNILRNTCISRDISLLLRKKDGKCVTLSLPLPPFLSVSVSLLRDKKIFHILYVCSRSRFFENRKYNKLDHGTDALAYYAYSRTVALLQKKHPNCDNIRYTKESTRIFAFT